MKNDIYVSLIDRLNDDPLTHRCEKCKVLIGALTEEKLKEAVERHKCKGKRK
jgi:uncharacterized protein with PIN domain